MEVLFLGKGNDCRPLLAEAIFNHLAPAGSRARRVGCDQPCASSAEVLALLERQGICAQQGTAGCTDGGVDPGEVVITVCSAGNGAGCPHCRPGTQHAHWGVHDPLQRRFGARACNDAELIDVYHILRARIERLLALVQSGADADGPRLHRELERIGKFLP